MPIDRQTVMASLPYKEIVNKFKASYDQLVGYWNKMGSLITEIKF